MSRASTVWSAVVGAIALLAGGIVPANAVGFAHDPVVSADPANYTPHALDGTVRAVAVVGDRVYVGGTFTTVRNAATTTQLTRRYLFSFDRATGTIATDFTPVLDGGVETLAEGPNGTVIVGGTFKNVQGATQRSLAMLQRNGTRVSTFRANTNGYVNKVIVRNGKLYAGGRFTKASGVAREHLAAFDATTGVLDSSFAIPVREGRVRSNGKVTRPSVREMDADAAGTRLVIIGNFRQVAGQHRQQIAMIDLQRASLTGWRTDRYPNDVSGSPMAYQCYQVFDTQMRDVEFSPDGAYFVVVTTGGAPDRNTRSLCDTTARWETAQKVSPTQPERETWFNCTGGDTLYSVAVTARADAAGVTTGGAVYVGGHQRWLDNCGGRDNAVPGSFAAEGIGAIDANTGKAIRTWNPGRTRGVGAEELLANGDGLYVGSDTERLGGEYHARLGLFPLR